MYRRVGTRGVVYTEFSVLSIFCSHIALSFACIEKLSLVDSAMQMASEYGSLSFLVESSYTKFYDLRALSLRRWVFLFWMIFYIRWEDHILYYQSAEICSSLPLLKIGSWIIPESKDILEVSSRVPMSELNTDPWVSIQVIARKWLI